MRLISKRLVDVGAQLIGVGYAQIKHRGLQTFVTQPMLDRSNRDLVLMPTRRARLAEPMQVPMFADWIGLASDVRFVLCFVAALGYCRRALTTVQPRVQRDPFQFPQEVIIRSAIFVDEYPPRMRSMFPPVFQ